MIGIILRGTSSATGNDKFVPPKYVNGDGKKTQADFKQNQVPVLVSKLWSQSFSFESWDLLVLQQQYNMDYYRTGTPRGLKIVSPASSTLHSTWSTPKSAGVQHQDILEAFS